MADCFRAGSDADSIQQIHRTICTDCRSRTHCARDDYRLIAPDRQIQEIRRFLQRIRTVCDHNPVHIATGQQLIATLGQFQPDVIRHVLAVDAANLLTADIRIIPDLWNSIDQHIDSQGTSLIPSRSSIGCSTAGNRSSGCQDLHIRFVTGSGKCTLDTQQHHCHRHKNY